MLPYQTSPAKDNKTAIIGLGGAGANVLQCFGASSADNVKLYTMSLDERLGRACDNVRFLQLGRGVNHGLGSGGDPEVGRTAAQESREEIAALLEDVRLVVMVVGLGGGTGSGAAPVLAELARERDIFLVSVALMPFAFEGRRRREQAERALSEISTLSDIVFCFENDYMEELFHNRSGARAVFEEVDRLLAKATASVPTLANSPGLINLGLDELAVALSNNDSRCIFGSGSGYGAKRARDAAKAALESPLLSHRHALGFSRTVIVHIAGGETMALSEIRTVMETVRAALASDEVDVFFGASVKPRLGDELRVTLIASVDAEEMKLAAEVLVESAETSPEMAARGGEFESDVEAVIAAEPEDEADAVDAVDALETAAEVSPEVDEAASSSDTLYDEEEEPLPAPPVTETPPPPMHQGMLLAEVGTVEDEDDEDSVSRARNLFADEEDSSQTPVSRYRGAASRRHSSVPDDDLDTPPSLRFNDLSGFFGDK